MKLALLGLGNPGIVYSCTRHNIGHWFVDRLAISNHVQFKTEQFFESTEYSWAASNIILFKSLSFMNCHGTGLSSLLERHSLSEDNFMLVQDEINLPLGRAKISKGKSAGGHNGVSNIIQEIGFSPLRLRIGVGYEKSKKIKLSDFVLSKFSQTEKESLEELFPKLIHALRLFVGQGFSFSSNYINRNPIPAPSN